MKKFLGVVLGLFLLLGCNWDQSSKKVTGILIMGHEVRAFREQGSDKEFWIIDKSGILMKKYQEIIGSSVINYEKVDARLEVINCTQPQDGFGAEYDGCYEVKNIISLKKHL